MFLWCGCHCEREGSEENPSAIAPSVTGSVNSYSSADPARPDPPTTPVVACLACAFGTAPQVFEFEWDYQGRAVKAYPPRPCCAIYTSQKKYRLYSRNTIGTDCVWGSNEQIKRRVPTPPFGTAATCVDAGGSRVELKLSVNTTNRPTGFLFVYYADSDLPTAAPLPIAGSFHAMYVLVDVNGSPVTNPGDRITCLRQLRFRAGWSLNNQPKTWVGSLVRNGVPFGSPCDQDSFSMIDSGLPEYVTCTPAPA